MAVGEQGCDRRAEELSVSLASSQSFIGLLFLFAFLVKLCHPSVDFLSTVLRSLSSQPFRPRFFSPFFFFLVKSLPALSAPTVTFMSFFVLSHCTAGRQTGAQAQAGARFKVPS